MINIEKLSYRVVNTIEDGTQLDITGAVTDLSWEENDGEIATKINVSLHNVKYKGKYLSDYCKPNTLIDIFANWGTTEYNVATGTVIDWECSEESDKDNFDITCYDDAYQLQKSDDHIYISKGISCKSAIQKICKDWGIELEYFGPETPLAQNAIKKKVSETILELLKEAKQKGGGDTIIRGGRHKISILRKGTNKTVWYLSSEDNIESVKSKVSTADIITRVKIIGKESDKKQGVVEAVIDGMTQYGIRQKIISRSSDEKLADAKKDAKTTIDEEGKPKKTNKVKGYDVPIMRKGDKVYIKTSKLDGYYYVVSITHDATSMKMSLEVEEVE